jgi:hypothetical protein
VVDRIELRLLDADHVMVTTRQIGGRDHNRQLPDPHRQPTVRQLYGSAVWQRPLPQLMMPHDQLADHPVSVTALAAFLAG